MFLLWMANYLYCRSISKLDLVQNIAKLHGLLDCVDLILDLVLELWWISSGVNLFLK